MNVPWQDHKLGFIGSYHPHHLLSLIARIQNNDFLGIDNILASFLLAEFWDDFGINKQSSTFPEFFQNFINTFI